MSSPSIVQDLILSLPTLRNHHAPGSSVYSLLKQVARREIEELFFETDAVAKEFGPFGDLILPYHKMGSVDSLNLFDLDELIIFSFYWVNRGRYRRVLDIGANIGLHSIVLSRSGYEVHSYEPDPQHFEVLGKDLELNCCFDVKAVNAAVSSEDGEKEFVRVLGNTTGSHLAGSKANPYGELQRFPVDVKGIKPLIEWADLIKLDAEGHEKEILTATNGEDWLNTDALVEVGTESNARYIYDYFEPLGVLLFSQKTNWNRVKDINDMPTSYHDGTLFITSKTEMPW